MTRIGIGRTLSALAATLVLSSSAMAFESSCPAPCTVPPKNALFMRDSGSLLAGGLSLSGNLQKGIRKTVVRLDVTFSLLVTANITDISVMPEVNGRWITFDMTGCDVAKTSLCTLTATYWYDVDAMEAAHPGEWVGKPLQVVVYGSTSVPTLYSNGRPYDMSFAAQIVKK
jgi:hypothetical protein